jgi:cobalt-zinc-cadmium efflux system outer membrane protein
VDPPQPTGELDLPDVLSFALTHSPRLSAYSTDIRIAEARAMQAARWPNPELDMEVEDIAGSGRFSGFDAAETTVSLSQTFPLGDDFARRRDLADNRTRLVNWDYEAARLAVLHQATQRFVDALAADRRIELAERELSLARATEKLTIQRVEAGDLSPVEKARVVVPVITAEVALERAQREREAAYRRVAATWGGRAVTFDRVAGDMERLDPPPSASALVELINKNPEVARWAAEIGQRLVEQRLAEAEAVPDLTGRVGMKHDNADDDVALVVGISLPLPIFDRRRGDILAARLGASAARHRQREAELRLEDIFSNAFAQLAGSHDEATALKARALPAATHAYDATRQAFDEGKLPFLNVLDAQRTLFNLQSRYIDALARYHTAAAEIEALIGRRLTELNQPVTPSGQETQP